MEKLPVSAAVCVVVADGYKCQKKPYFKIPKVGIMYGRVGAIGMEFGCQNCAGDVDIDVM